MIRFKKTNPFKTGEKEEHPGTGKKLLSLVLAAAMLLSTAGCASYGSSNPDVASEKTSSEISAETVETVSEISETDMFTKRDLSADYSESEAIIVTLDENNSSCESDSVKIEGQTVTICDEGIYLLSGTLSDGQIVVDAEDSDKVQIVLNGASIRNDSSAAIYAKQADKVFVTLAPDTENTLETTGEYEAIDENSIDGVVFSKCDLTMNGTGSLTVNGSTGHGIVGKDDLVLSGGTYTITAAKKCISANDSIRIADGTYVLNAGTDALNAKNSDDDSKGFIYIKDGTITINAEDDAIHASSSILIAGGTIEIESCYEGLEGQTIVIDNGQIDIVATDDGLNATSGNSNADLSDESDESDDFRNSARSGDSANARNFSSTDGFSKPGESYDSMHSENSGNSGGTNDSNTVNPSGNFRENAMATHPTEEVDNNASITINGGTLHVNASGDGIDSNGSILITGGSIVVEGPENSGNGVLDAGSGAVITGGTFISSGSSGMAVNFSNNSTQGAILQTVSSATGTITLKDDSGHTILSMDTDKRFDSVLVSAPELQEGGTYTLTTGGTDTSIEMNSLIVGSGGMMTGGPGMMQGKGGMQGGFRPEENGMRGKESLTASGL